MTCRGYVKNGQITLDGPMRFPEGAEVIVALAEASNSCEDELSSLLLRHAAKGEGLPDDLAAQHDHYSHGKPKQ